MEVMTMKGFWGKLKKNWITIWLITTLVAVGSLVAYAAYTGINSVKRVVSMTDSAGVLFSSNSMQSYRGEAIPFRHISTTQEKGYYTYNLTVCDYAQSDPLTRYVSQDGIPYNLTAQLCIRINGVCYPLDDTNVPDDVRTDAASKTYSIQYVSDGGENVASGNTVFSLNGGELVNFNSQLIRPQVAGESIPNGTNKYAIVFDKCELEGEQPYDYYIKLTANPTNGDASLDRLACYLYLTQSSAVDSSWNGRLLETDNTSDYDAYNYILQGSGSGIITVRWNSNYLDVSEIFLAENNLTVLEEDVDGETWKKFELPVGETEGSAKANRYEIQLYKNNQNGNYDDVLNYISSSYTVN